MSQVTDYLNHTTQVMLRLPVDDIERLIELFDAARREGRRIFACGNGGSASLASHLACDLNKGCSQPGRRRFRIVALTDNLATITAYGNDLSYADIFAEQLQNQFEPGDVVLGISGSGNSENVVRALRWARERGGLTCGLIGFGGGRMKDLCDVHVIADSHDMQHCEDAHVVVMHLMMQALAGKVAADVD